jgi:hypothetical protein
MKTVTQLGIWMDHACANLFDPSDNATQLRTIFSSFTHQDKEERLIKSEKLMHNKEQHEQASYYKEIGEEIKHYDEIILFGPTTAKAELHNLLSTDHHFDHIKIACKQAGKLTHHQQQAYVKEYFASR